MFGNYMYFDGGNKSPYIDEGFSFWWKVESYAYSNKDEKEKGKLSDSMITYLRNLHWEGDAQSDTSYEEFIKRASEMYIKGVYDRRYLCDKKRELNQ